jgi:non-ribosomal peptide synthetase component F
MPHQKFVGPDYTFQVTAAQLASTLVVGASNKPSRLSDDQAQLILDEFEFTIRQVCTELRHGVGVSSMWLLSPPQTEFIASASFGAEVPLPYELLHHAFEERAKGHPDVRAVEFEGAWLTYGELNAQADTHVGVRVGRVGCVCGETLW